MKNIHTRDWKHNRKLNICYLSDDGYMELRIYTLEERDNYKVVVNTGQVK